MHNSDDAVIEAAIKYSDEHGPPVVREVMIALIKANYAARNEQPLNSVLMLSTVVASVMTSIDMTILMTYGEKLWRIYRTNLASQIRQQAKHAARDGRWHSELLSEDDRKSVDQLQAILYPKRHV